MNEILKEVEEYVYVYQQAEEALGKIKMTEQEVRDAFAVELEAIAELQQNIEERIHELLIERGVPNTAKEYEEVKKAVRQTLYPMMHTLQEQNAFVGKTLKLPEYELTLVEQSPVLAPVPDATLDMHKHDVHLLVNNNMYTSLQIVPDEDTLNWMRLRSKNEMGSIQSVEIQARGYVKVKLL